MLIDVMASSFRAGVVGVRVGQWDCGSGGGSGVALGLWALGDERESSQYTELRAESSTSSVSRGSGESRV